MMARLGQALYWTGCVIAALFLISGALNLNDLVGGIGLPGEKIYRIAVAFFFAVIAWLLGRACRYALSGD